MGVYNGVHLVYAPFKGSQDQKKAVEDWNQTNGFNGTVNGDDVDGKRIRTSKNFVFIDENDPVIDPALDFTNAATNANNVIYVLGHTTAGIGVMTASNSALNWEYITATSLAAKIAGLIGAPAFAGGIKIFGCSSAWSVFGYSFAHSFAKTLVTDHKYTRCKIFGYTESVTGYGADYTDVKDKDKFEFHKLAGSTYVDVLDNMREKHKRAKSCRLLVADNGKLV